MTALSELFDNNEKWAAGIEKDQPGFFEKSAKGQSPKYLWIGCADSRVPASVVTGLGPGEMFVHRNVANLVVHTDLNLLTVLQYAVEHLGVEHAIVCGHYGCGGVAASLAGSSFGVIDNWLRHIKDVRARNESELKSLDGDARVNRLCELNVAAQVVNLCATTAVQDAWKAGKKLNVHGLIYDLGSGRLKDLDLSVSSAEQLDAIYRI